MKTIEEVVSKYGDVLVTFSSYYKYSFFFGADIEDGIHIGLSIGGCADDVYRLSVNTDPISIKQLHTENEITFIYAKQGETKLFSISNY